MNTALPLGPVRGHRWVRVCGGGLVTGNVPGVLKPREERPELQPLNRHYATVFLSRTPKPWVETPRLFVGPSLRDAQPPRWSQSAMREMLNINKFISPDSTDKLY